MMPSIAVGIALTLFFVMGMLGSMFVDWAEKRGLPWLFHVSIFVLALTLGSYVIFGLIEKYVSAYDLLIPALIFLALGIWKDYFTKRPSDIKVEGE